MEIQRSLMTMFGDRNALTNSSHASSSRGGSSTIFIPPVVEPIEVTVDSAPKNQEPPKLLDETRFNADNMLDTDPVSAESLPINYSAPGSDGENSKKWQCKICTLINASSLETCEACDNPR